MRIQFAAQKENEITTLGERQAHSMIKEIKEKYKQITHAHGKVFAKAALHKYLDMDAQRLAIHLSKKEHNHVRIAAKRITSGRYSPLQLLNWYHSQTGVLKCAVDHILEILAYKFDRENYLKKYCRDFGFYGMSKEDAGDRFDRYHEGLLERDYVKAVYDGVKYWGKKK